MKIKTIHLLILAILIITIMGFSRNQTEDYHEIGDVKYSILPPNAFTKTQKGTWVLLDGKPIGEDQKLYSLLEQEFLLDIFKDESGIVKLPNAKGRFIRSMNINGQGDDPDIKRNVGSYQADQIKQHRHTFNSHGGSKNGYGNVIDGKRQNKITLNTSFSGGEETRPKNISLYTYIKIAN